MRATAKVSAIVMALLLVTAFHLSLPVGDLDGRLVGLGDPALNTWALGWEWDALTGDPSRIFDGNIYHPNDLAIVYSESMLPLVPVFGVFRTLTGSSVAAMNLLMLLLVALAVFGASALAARFTERRASAVLAGVSYGFGAYVMSHLGHVQLLTLGLIPLTVLVALVALERRSPRWGVGLGLMTAVTGLSSLYHLLLMAVALSVLVLLDATQGEIDRAWLVTIATAVGVVAVLTLPVLVPYASLHADQGLERPIDPRFGLNPVDLVTPSATNWVYRDLGEAGNRRAAATEHTFFPGFLVLALAAGGAVVARRTPRRRELLGLGAAGGVTLVLATGGEVHGVAMPFTYLHRHVPGFDGVRATARFGVIALLVIALLGAIWVDRLSSRLERRTGRAAGAALLIAAIIVTAVELRAPRTWRSVAETAPVQEELAGRDPGPVLELPMWEPVSFGWAHGEAPRMLRSLVDGNPRVNGYSGYSPPGYHEDVLVLNQVGSPAWHARVDALRVRYVVLNIGHTERGLPQYSEQRAVTVIESIGPRAVATRHGDAWLVDLNPG